ncbi:MAG: hypothetical protein A3D31_01885 [Candidatus Fluviicola riflensis]|nr:MAG: hypothetical protein CHH17_13150 [Candidatus Fluviicola riflensis]OGS78749.1 MAG: hypothetical protein A3D31_01885 [Candidatus Fluviicola riflensis]OGS86180.1 MAG: hypothetical protein A2724_01340 [Fluviicola sp. RIFCSPHIGHO2_01_FULL_43_53]
MKPGIILFCLFLAFAGLAQKPETVYGIAKERREESWYLTQLEGWKKLLDVDKTNGEAWYNYYKASRALRNISESDETRKKYNELCAQIVNDAYAAIPNSFEANHLKWAEGGNNESLFSYLKKAHEIDPTDMRAYEDLATYYETQHNKAEYHKFAELMYKHNTMHASIVNWGYNLLAGVDQNAILFAAGDNDTYSAWVAQEGLNFRKDVRVVNLHLMMIDSYRDQLLKELGFPPLAMRSEVSTKPENYHENRMKILDHFLKNSSIRPIHIAVSAMHSLTDESWKEKLYLTGLTYKYSEESFDNISVIVRNYEKRYLTDHMKHYFSFGIGEKVADQLNGCYLVSMLKLYEHYITSEQESRAAEIKQLLLDVSKKSGQENDVKEYFDKLEKAK